MAGIAHLLSGVLTEYMPYFTNEAAATKLRVLVSYTHVKYRVEEYRESEEGEQQIYGDSRAVWDRCIVHGLFSAQPDMDSIQEHLQDLTNGPPLQFEAGDLHLHQYHLLFIHSSILQFR